MCGDGQNHGGYLATAGGYEADKSHTLKMATKTDLVKLILSKRGNVSAVARSYRVSRKAIMDWIEEDPEAQRALKDARETALDDGEDALGKAVKKGEPWAVCFLLKTQGKERGYIERNEVTGKDGDSIKIVVQYANPDPDPT